MDEEKLKKLRALVPKSKIVIEKIKRKPYNCVESICANRLCVLHHENEGNNAEIDPILSVENEGVNIKIICHSIR